jgi:hypothetical protein
MRGRPIAMVTSVFDCVSQKGVDFALAEGTFPTGEFRCATAFTALNRGLRLSRTSAEVLRTVLARAGCGIAGNAASTGLIWHQPLRWGNAGVRKYALT